MVELYDRDDRWLGLYTWFTLAEFTLEGTTRPHPPNATMPRQRDQDS